METPNKKTALVAGVAVAATMTAAALAMAVWPALTRPDPPAEASGDGGLRIRIVQPPRAMVASAGPLEVGLSEAAQAMAKGREALFVATQPVRPTPPQTPARRAPIQVAHVDEEEDLALPPEPDDDRWEREEAWRRDRYEEAQQRRWEEQQRWARRDREERAAWEQAQRERWEQDRREEDRYAPPPPPPGW